MSRVMDTGIVTLPDDSLGQPRGTVKTTPGETWVLTGMIAKGSNGVTTRDFLGADLRHYIRALKHKGVGIRDEWESDSFGKHKRWFLKEGHTLERVPEKRKPATAATVQASNLNPIGENGGLLDAST